jgi:hypothetical protein
MGMSSKSICPGSFKQMIWSEERGVPVCADCKNVYSVNIVSNPGTPHNHLVMEESMLAKELRTESPPPPDTIFVMGPEPRLNINGLAKDLRDYRRQTQEHLDYIDLILEEIG